MLSHAGKVQTSVAQGLQKGPMGGAWVYASYRAGLLWGYRCTQGNTGGVGAGVSGAGCGHSVGFGFRGEG